MNLRLFFVFSLVLLSGPTVAAPAMRATPPAAPTPPMVFYVVKGAPDACGHGCDSWIAAEGQIDNGAAPRFRNFLARVRDRHLPIYFSSPGGNLDQALAMGAMLRERPAVAGVARVTVSECGFEAQNSDACLRLKQSGRELHGDLRSRGASCNSACPYLILGATTREIAPDAVLAVHSPKVVPVFRGGLPTPQMRAEAAARGHERADRMVIHYIVQMGAEPGLMVVASATRFEELHVLTREEIYRFGIDRREFAETPWTFENLARGVVHKTAIQKDGERSFRTTQWRVLCFNREQFELDFQRQTVAGTLFPTVAISTGGPKPLYLTPASSKPSGMDLWGVRMTKSSLQVLAELPQFDFTETSQAIDGHRLAHSAKFSGQGLSRALDGLLASCPAPTSAAPLQTIGSRDSTAK